MIVGMKHGGLSIANGIAVAAHIGLKVLDENPGGAGRFALREKVDEKGDCSQKENLTPHYFRCAKL